MFNLRGPNRLRVGDRALLNGAVGKIVRASIEDFDEMAFVQIEADMLSMDPRYVGGFSGARGPLCVMSIAAVTSVDLVQGNRELFVSHMGVPLPISYRDNPMTRNWCSYYDVWMGHGDITVDRTRCLSCEQCSADSNCPMSAIPSDGPDMDLCLSCGLCISSCKGGLFSGEMGHISFDGREVPIIIRLSSRRKAEELCEVLRDMVIEGRWPID